MMNHRRTEAILLCAATIVILQSGCAVPQGRGNGRVSHETEPTLKAGYWLYLPEGYVENDGHRPGGKRWPLVVTFHGMKPYDNANPQIREWQQEADRYGFVVIAPELKTCDSFMQYPLRNPDLPYVQRDEKAIMAVMDDVFRRTSADPEHVLATSWSSGGYIAHFIVNRHPERFSCIAVRQSNFNEELLDPHQVPKYRNYPVAIFFGENDFKACREESKRAVLWYQRHRFPYIEAKYVGGLGHERTPQTAAAFFAADMGIAPRTPPDLAGLVMYDIPQEDLGPVPPAPVNRSRYRPPPADPGGQSSAQPSDDSPRSPSSNVVFSDPASGNSRVEDVQAPPPSYRAPSTVLGPSQNRATPRRPSPQPYLIMDSPAPRDAIRRTKTVAAKREYAHYPDIPAQMEIQGDTVGVAPMLVSLHIDMPDGAAEGASVLWMDNEEPIGNNGLSLQRILRDPGEHDITAHIITSDDRNLILRKRIRVLTPVASRPAGN